MKELLVIREPGKQLAPDFAKLVVSQFKTAFGCASPQKDTLVDTDIFNCEEHDITGNIMEIDRSYQGDRVVYHFVDATAEGDDINVESLQPFLALTNGKEGKEAITYLAVVMVGDWPEVFNKKDAEDDMFSPAFKCFDRGLMPIITEAYESSGNDLNAMMGMLTRNPYKAKVDALLGDRAAITFIPYKGMIQANSNLKEPAANLSFGYVSDTLGYKEEAPAATVVNPNADKPKMGLGKQKPVTAAAAAPSGGSPISAAELYAPIIKANNRYKVKDNELWYLPGGSMKEARASWNSNTTLPYPQDPHKVFEGFRVTGKDAPLNPSGSIAKFLIQKLGSDNQPKKAESEQGPSKAPASEPSVTEPAEKTLFLNKDDKAAYLGMKAKGRLPLTTIEKITERRKKFPLTFQMLGEQRVDMYMLDDMTFDRLPANMKTTLYNDLRCECLGITREDEGAPPVEEKPVEEAAPIAAPPAAKRGLGKKVA